MEALIHNIGQLLAEDIVVRFYQIDPDTNQMKQIGKESKIERLSPGKGRVINTWIKKGINEALISIDPENQIVESNEDNNQIIFSF
ncbi:MAG: CARDB domain-containing protein [bacterium]